ncbi:MAG: hypothetical protein QOJ26_1022 [Thermoplasmata archaeon]|jgi:hypothetical protein|nr:hypothetical protein [Thermoplasmata archaeon]MEA3166153.1 hypothetical protein [Thermoplasmata archaeon]
MTSKDRSLGDDESGVSAVLAVLLTVVITVTLAGVFLIISKGYVQPRAEPAKSEGQAQFSDGLYEVTAVGPDDLLLSDGHMLIDLNGAVIDRPLTDLAPQLEDGTHWRAGESVCMVGPSPCLYAGAVTLGMKVIAGDKVVFEVSPLTSTYPIQVPVFELMPAGGIRLLEPANIRTDVIGTSLNYGAGGPVIPVTAKLTANGGTTYTSLYSGQAVGAGNSVTLTGTTPGAILGVQGHAEYLTLFSATYDSVHGDPHVWVLQDGGDAPDVAPFTGQASLKSYLEPYVDPTTNRVTLANNQVIMLFEFNTSLTGSAADFQDLVVLFTFD